MPSHLLSVIIFLPLLGLPALLMLRSEDHTWIRRIALAVSLAEFVISLAFLLPTFSSANPGYQFVENHPWVGNAIQYHIGVDGISLFLVLRPRIRERLLRLAAGDRNRHDRRFRFARSVPVLRFLGTDADSHVFPGRHMGPHSPHLRRREIHSLHHVWLHSDAGRDFVALQSQRHARPRPHLFLP